MNQVYSNNGIGLRYVDAGTEEAKELVSEGRCAVIIPKRFDTTPYGEFRVAHVTGWPTQAEKAAGKVFLLSDQADLTQLLNFVAEARPKTVLTFHGGSRVLAELVSKRFGISARVLSADIPRSKPTKAVIDEERVAHCENYILTLIQVPELTYEKRDIVARALVEGFKVDVVEEALNRLTQRNALRYSSVTEGYSTP